LTQKGLKQIVAIKSHLPQGLNNSLKFAFPSFLMAAKQFIPSTEPLNPNWIAGFVDGDGHFTLGWRNSRYKLGATRIPLFSVGQNGRDIILLQRILSSLDCGSIRDIGERLF
jgi:LAGLIDADG endonuclease